MHPESLIPALALLAVMSRELLWIAGIGIAILNLDDLAVDVLWLALVALRPAPVPPPAPTRQGHLAVLVPAWDEAAVIGPMLSGLLAAYDHPVTLFVGTYPNDPATAAAVDAVADARVRRVTGARPGPTTKADCLNGLWRAVLAEEAQRGAPFRAIVLHDAEDVVDPGEPALIDRWLEAHAMIQLPVLPLADPSSPWIAGHYLDEFAQSHTRDLMLRSALGAPMPSAGVATAIRRDAMAALDHPDGPFDASSLTEDYEVGHRLHALGFSGRMVRARADGRLIATREFFPATLDAAVRQKARWLTGIALDGWDRLGWGQTLVDRWMLARDRRGLLTAALTVLAWGAAALLLSQSVVRLLAAEAAGAPLPPLLAGTENAALRWLLLANALLLGWRLCWRAAFTAHAHGPREGLRAIPRALVTNLVNVLAAWRALDRYRTALAGGERRWDKTAHRFPEPRVG